MSITVAKNAGFCFGVKKAVDSVYQAVDHRESIVVLGELIHNRQVISDLEGRGVVFIDNPEQCPEEATLVIRTHGVGKSVMETVQRKAEKVLDLTCPYVKKIHKIVSEQSDRGYHIVIVGDKQHPEVVGITGWCKDADVVYNAEDARKIAKDRICVVAQTTIKPEIFTNTLKILKNNCKEVLVFDTICKATKTRQQEAALLAAESDIMFVVGGRNSSNTKKLFEICKQACTDTYYLESFEDLPQNINYQNKKIGITAGASTPDGTIREVLSKMSELTNTQEMSFEEAMEQSLKTLNTGDVVTGIVVEVRQNEVIVDLGFKSDGIIPAGELDEDPDVKPSDLVKVGDEIKVFVVGVNDAEGKTLLSKKKLAAIAGWEKIQNAVEEKTILEGKVIQIVNGGMIVLVEGTKVFVPASQASDRFTQDLDQFLNKKVNLRILEINPRRKKVIGSVRSVLTEQKKAAEEQFWSSAEVGKKYTGVVKSVTSFGAFVDIGGVDGLVHISELSWSRIKHPSEVLKVGDNIDVYIKEINPETKKISLGHKLAEDNPWAIAQTKFNLGDVVTCKVVRMLPFGAFVELMPGVDGLIHISQIANRRIGKPADVLSIGQEVEAKITDLKWEEKKISLSIRALIPIEAPTAPEAEEKAEPAEDAEPTSYTEDTTVTVGDVVSMDIEETENQGE